MFISDLQNEINHLVFLYFTSIGVLQRDCKMDNVKEIISDLNKEMKDCVDRILKFLDEEEEEVELKVDNKEIVRRSKEYLEEGYEFLDRILENL